MVRSAFTDSFCQPCQGMKSWYRCCGPLRDINKVTCLCNCPRCHGIVQSGASMVVSLPHHVNCLRLTLPHLTSSLHPISLLHPTSFLPLYPTLLPPTYPCFLSTYPPLIHGTHDMVVSQKPANLF